MAGYPIASTSAEDSRAGTAPGRPPAAPATVAAPLRRTRWYHGILLLLMLGAHAVGCVGFQGGWSQVVSPWPPAMHDHPMHYHNAVVTRSFLNQNGTTAGYDPYFMSGYAKSIISDPSGTMIEAWVAAFGGDNPARAYKLLVLLAMGSLPLLVAMAIRIWGGRGDALCCGTALFLVYLWTDFPLAYAGLGMVSFLLVIPLGMVVLALVERYLARGGFGRWLAATLGAILVFFVHPLCALTVGPAVLATYGWMVRARGRLEPKPGWSRHVGLWLMPPIVLAANWFWWLPAVTLWETRLSRGLGFYHTEGVLPRLGQILGLSEPSQGPIQAVLLAGALIGLASSGPRRRSAAVALGTFVGAGFFWGYLAGAFRAFDAFEPGRNTYAAYTGAAAAAGLGWGALRARLRPMPSRLDRWVALGLLLVGIRLFLPSLLQGARIHTGRDPIPRIEWAGGGMPRILPGPATGTPPDLASEPGEDQRWLVDAIEANFDPGDRILYEEGGRSSEELVEPFGGRRFGGLLPSLAGVEVIGGPFLHVPIRENFTQFGMGQLFGIADWGREDFERFAELYGPEGIVCWSPRARTFCRENPDLCEILEERGSILIARVRGFEGDAIRGRATVEAEAGRLKVEPESADVDGMIVLRYHSVPGLRSDPPGLLRAVELPGDPVPFIGLARPDGPVTIEWDSPP
ncbi:hypothetical protein [Tautonia plasticadhaerens]|uniref:Glycosyltransferase RgtA/B/C/D-like domain-containing protein n=1 Tax=Tautonia plasticadhaerens TaxID=2527974 RepID=A0A518GYC9_9BACT|nr:hypothetical protein [Tautonia plasticadhaerens]QDV33598.1 hypothetical protein ElP_14720 [Tautonia plasticadhaerens]